MITEEALLRRTPVKYKKARVENISRPVTANGFISLPAKDCPLEVNVGDYYFVPSYDEKKDEGLGYFIEVTNDPEYPVIDHARLRMMVVGDLTKMRSIGELLQTLYKQHLSGYALIDLVDDAMLTLHKHSPETCERLVAHSEQTFAFDLSFLATADLPVGLRDISIIVTDQDGAVKSKNSMANPGEDGTITYWNGLYEYAYLESSFSDKSTGESDRLIHAIFPSIGTDLSVTIMLIRCDNEKYGRVFVDQNDNLHTITFDTYVRNFLGINLDLAMAKYYCTNDISPLTTVSSPGADSVTNGTVAGYAFIKSLAEKYIASNLDDYLADIRAIVNGDQEIEATFIPNSEA